MPPRWACVKIPAPTGRIQIWILIRVADIFAFMKRGFHIYLRLRRRGTWLALFAMLLQSLGAASHAGAMAAVVAGNPYSLTGMPGLVQICTPAGIAEIDPGKLAPGSKPSVDRPCPLCSASALGAFTFARTIQTHIPLSHQISRIVIPRQILGMGFVSGRMGLSRAPPV